MATQTQPVAALDAISGWWPSEYGADDEAGALNEITAGKTLEAVRPQLLSRSWTWLPRA